jgi:LacI family transcriptional regulator
VPRAPRKRTGRVTLQEVADRAGVSIATASFAINNTRTGKVSEETRRRILDVAAKIGYRPNAMAQGLSRAASSFVGLVTDAIATTPFAGDLIRGAQDAAWQHNHLLLIVNTGADSHTEIEAIKLMHTHQVRGIVYSTWYHRRVKLPEGLTTAPAVLANCYVTSDSIQAFVPDEVQGGRTATEALIAAGHTRIAFINSSLAAPATTGRLSGFRAAMRAHGLPVDPQLVVLGAS